MVSSGAKRIKLQVRNSQNKKEVQQLSLEIMLQNPLALFNLSSIR